MYCALPSIVSFVCMINKYINWAYSKRWYKNTGPTQNIGIKIKNAWPTQNAGPDGGPRLVVGLVRGPGHGVQH